MDVFGEKHLCFKSKTPMFWNQNTHVFFEQSQGFSFSFLSPNNGEIM